MAISSFAATATSSGLSDFVLTLDSSNNIFPLDREYPAGVYSIEYVSVDNSYDIYFTNSSNEAIGYSNSGTITASSSFNKVNVLGVLSPNIITFKYDGLTALADATTSDAGFGAYITAVSDSTLVSQNDTTIITGGNFSTSVGVIFKGTDNISRSAKSITRTSSSSLTVTRPDTMPPSASPYSVIVSNSGIPMPTGSNAHILANSVTAGGTPVWVTASGALVPNYAPDSAYTTTISATDVDGAVAYSVVSGSLPVGLSLNSTTGVISGTVTSANAAMGSFTIRATDTAGNFLDRAFTLSPSSVITGGTLSSDSTYFYRTFTASGTFAVGGTNLSSADILIVAGGGGGGQAMLDGGYQGGGGGGGAGGLVYVSGASLAIGSYTVTVGGGGATNGGNGANSSFTGQTTAVGGGFGSNGGNTARTPGNGGSGGGRGSWGTDGGSGGTGTAGQGNNGAQNFGGYESGGGGGGATAAGVKTNNGTSTQCNGGAGSSAFSSWASATSTGSSSAYAGGGGGGMRNGTSPSAGGVGGGGTGSRNDNIGGTAATASTGGGGGGASWISGGGIVNGFSGGSGIVIVRYLKTAV
jgi:hypothetical protein